MLNTPIWRYPSILTGFSIITYYNRISIINHPFWGIPIYWNPHMVPKCFRSKWCHPPQPWGGDSKPLSCWDGNGRCCVDGFIFSSMVQVFTWFSPVHQHIWRANYSQLVSVGENAMKCLQDLGRAEAFAKLPTDSWLLDLWPMGSCDLADHLGKIATSNKKDTRKQSPHTYFPYTVFPRSICFIWRFPEIGLPHFIINFHGIFHEANHPASLGVPPWLWTPPICSHTLHTYFPSTDPFAWPSQWPRLEELLAKQVSSQSHLEATTLCLLAWQGMEWGCNTMAGWWFQTFFIFHNIWDNPSHWLIFLKMVKNHHPVVVSRGFLRWTNPRFPVGALGSPGHSVHESLTGQNHGAPESLEIGRGGATVLGGPASCVCWSNGFTSLTWKIDTLW